MLYWQILKTAALQELLLLFRAAAAAAAAVVPVFAAVAEVVVVVLVVAVDMVPFAVVNITIDILLVVFFIAVLSALVERFCCMSFFMPAAIVRYRPSISRLVCNVLPHTKLARCLCSLALPELSRTGLGVQG